MKNTAPTPETGITVMPVADLIPSIEFQPGKPSEYAANIRRLADLVKFSGEAFAVNTIRLGRYCRDVKHELALKGGDQGFQKWIEEAVPNLSYNSVAVAMRTAKMIGDAHPELRRLDSPEKVEALSRLVDGKTFTAVAQEFGAIKRPGLGVKEAKRPALSPAENADEARRRQRLNFMEAMKRLEKELELGSAGALEEAELNEVIGALGDYAEKVRSVRDARKTGGKPAAKKPRDAADL